MSSISGSLSKTVVRKQDDETFIADWASPEPRPAPFTNIAWRLSHIGFVLNMRADYQFGNGTLTPLNAPWPGSAHCSGPAERR